MPRLVLLTLLCLAVIIQTAAFVWMQTSLPLATVVIQTENGAVKNKAHAICLDEEITKAADLPNCRDATSCDCIGANCLLFPPNTPLFTELTGKTPLPTRPFAPYYTRAIPHYRPPIG